MRKTGSKGYFILSATFFVIAVFWLLWNQSVAMAIVWFCAAIIELLIALAVKRKE